MRSWLSGCVMGLMIGFIVGIVAVFGTAGIRYNEVAVAFVSAAAISFAVAKLGAQPARSSTRQV